MDDTFTGQTAWGDQRLAPGFLIAVPGLADPNFARTVILLVESGPWGSYGMVINRPAPVDLATLLDGAGIPRTIAPKQAVWLGGPVQPEAGLVLYVDEPQLDRYEPFSVVAPPLRLSSSMNLLRAIADGAGPRTYALFLGRASWGAGQLEAELSAGVWLPAELDPALLFHADTDGLWRRALRTIGADPAIVATGGAEA